MPSLRWFGAGLCCRSYASQAPVWITHDIDQRPADATMSFMDLEVRDTVDGDAVEIAALLGELGYPKGAAQVRSTLNAATGDNHFVLVAAGGGRVVGVLSAAVIPLLAEAATMMRITALSVAAPVRGRGVGRMLVEAELGFEDANTKSCWKRF